MRSIPSNDRGEPLVFGEGEREAQGVENVAIGGHSKSSRVSIEGALSSKIVPGVAAGAEAVESCRGEFMDCSGGGKTPGNLGIYGVLCSLKVSIST